jgi:hypothetical protein
LGLSKGGFVEVHFNVRIKAPVNETDLKVMGYLRETIRKRDKKSDENLKGEGRNGKESSRAQRRK